MNLYICTYVYTYVLYKCKVLDLLDKNALNSEQSVSKLHFMVTEDSKVSSPIWDFSENQILLYIEKTLSVRWQNK